MSRLLGALRLGDGGFAHVFADVRLGAGGRDLRGGVGEQREFVVAEPDREDLGACVAADGSSGSGAHWHEVTVSHGRNLLQYDWTGFRIARTDFTRYDKSMTRTRIDTVYEMLMGANWLLVRALTVVALTGVSFR